MWPDNIITFNTVGLFLTFYHLRIVATHDPYYRIQLCCQNLPVALHCSLLWFVKRVLFFVVVYVKVHIIVRYLFVYCYCRPLTSVEPTPTKVIRYTVTSHYLCQLLHVIVGRCGQQNTTLMCMYDQLTIVLVSHT